MSVKILAIETSCDETSAAVCADGELLSNIISSQVDIHAKYGGVVPEIASRNHLLKLPEVIGSALTQSGIPLSQIDAVAVTHGPGLVGALLVGVSYAKALAFGCAKKLIGVNHLAGHIAANYQNGFRTPFLCLIVSGGHTMLVKVTEDGQYSVIGTTKDDAAGEAFDKIARVIGLGYPGGPKLDKLAEEGDANAYALPRAMLREEHYDFSFSGIKSAALNIVNQAPAKGLSLDKASLCASLRQCICEILVQKTMRAAKEFSLDRIAACGGVSCNSLLRSMLKDACAKENYLLSLPDPLLCSDNAGMIALAAHGMFLRGEFSDYYLNASPNLRL